MNLAIEYFLRDKRARNMLSLPCSLCVFTKEHKLVICIQNKFNDNEKLIVKHWRLWETQPNDRLPPFTEHEINKEELFASDVVILKDYSILPYAEMPFESGQKQYADYPLSHHQDKEYKSILESLYNSDLHQLRRINWLWEIFEKIYVSEDLRFHYGEKDEEGLDLQREIVRFYSKPIWQTWLYWQKYLLISKGIASELIFKKEYPVRRTRYGFIIPNRYQSLGSGWINSEN